MTFERLTGASPQGHPWPAHGDLIFDGALADRIEPVLQGLVASVAHAARADG